MKTKQPSTLTSTTLPLSGLRLDTTANVRKGGGGADPELVASIKAIGLKNPLLVRPNGQGHAVFAGGRRLEALQVLAAAGDIPADHPVPVVIEQATDAAAREISLAENVVRHAMHPVDEFRAFAELHADKTTPLSIEAIATRFGLPVKHVEQRLALGRLHDKVLNAWREGRMNSEGAQAFTLCPDKATQERILGKFHKGDRIDAWNIKNALKIGHDNIGRLLPIIGIDAYQKRGGKITADLFGSDHVVSDPKLLQAMIQEKLDGTCKQLLSEGWSWATTERPNNDWQYGRLESKPPSPAQRKRLDELRDVCDAEDQDEDSAAYIKASAECDAIENEIARNAYSADQKKKAGCFVRLNHHNGTIQIDAGRVKPSERRSVEAQERAKTGVAKQAKRKGDDHVSNALVQRLSEQLTTAASAAIVKQPTLAMAALLAGFASHDKTVDVRQRGLITKKTTHGNDYPARRPAAFNGALTTMIGKSVSELQAALAQIAAQALDFQVFNSDGPPLKDAGVAALCNAIDAGALNKALRSTFDAKDYFESVARSVVVSAVNEAMGADHAAKVAKMKKAAAAKFATANVPKTGWLPSQLRTAHYDGPAKKKTTAKPAGKTAKKTKAAARKKRK